MLLSPIKLRYLLVLEIPVHQDGNGDYWTDPLWHKDLLAHLAYIENFTMACPCLRVEKPDPDLVRLDPRIKLACLPGRHKLSLNFFATAARLWKAVRASDVIHTGLGGWLPISICNMTSLMAYLNRRLLFIVIESSTWRILPGGQASLLARLKAGLAEWINKSCLERVSLAIFTHPEYKKSLMVSRPERGHVIHASWIDQSVIITLEQLKQDWLGRSSNPRLKILFAGRVTAAKGIAVLLEVMRELDRRGQGVELSVIGQGDLLDECVKVQASLRCAKIEIVEPISYGPAFFTFLRQFDAVVIPSLSDEQPRIVYDAYSQGVPVLACNTAGLRACIEDGVTGKLCQPNDPQALLELLEWAAEHPETLKAFGTTSLKRADEMTHQHMHRKRWELLNKQLKQWAV